MGLVTGGSGLGRDFRASIEILKEQYNLTVLLSPEHGAVLPVHRLPFDPGMLHLLRRDRPARKEGLRAPRDGVAFFRFAKQAVGVHDLLFGWCIIYESGFRRVNVKFSKMRKSRKIC